MHVERLGNGPDLVMLHGWAMHAGIFAPVLPALSKRFTLHLVDLPGHGRSPAPEAGLDLDAMADAVAELVPAGAAWLGWSLGGLVAMNAATRQSERVGRLILAAATPRFTRAEHWPHGVDAGVFEEFAQDLDTDFNGTLQRFLALEVHGSDTARDDLARLREDAFRHGAPDPRALADGLDLLRHTDLTGALDSLALPVLCLGGRRDRLVPWQALHETADALPDARCDIIPGAGHAPFIGHPGGFVESVKGFLHGRLERASGE